MPTSKASALAIAVAAWLGASRSGLRGLLADVSTARQRAFPYDPIAHTAAA